MTASIIGKLPDPDDWDDPYEDIGTMRPPSPDYIEAVRKLCAPAVSSDDARNRTSAA